MLQQTNNRKELNGKSHQQNLSRAAEQDRIV